MVNLKINGIQASVPEKTTILKAAASVGVDIPTLCYLKDVNEIGACRVCTVEVSGVDALVTACNTEVCEGMEILTDSPKVIESRKTVLNLILSQHNFNCTECVRNENCTLQTLLNKYNITESVYKQNIKKPLWDKNAVLIRDESKCVKCMRCVSVCDKIQDMNIWDVVNTGSRTTVGVSKGRGFRDTDCTLCGKCITSCPTGALYARDDVSKVTGALRDANKTVVVQVAPAVRTAWGENIGLPKSFATTGRMVATLKKLGFNYVFDTNFAADLTIMEESSELVEKLKNKDSHSFPMFTSCCPGWVRFLKGQFPEFTDNLSTAKSPQQMFGAVAKSYFAEKIGVEPQNIFVVSVMPCVSKKSECDLPNLKDACGDNDVDVVLTTREFQRMIANAFIDWSEIGEENFDSPLGESTGAGAIFGTTGGVMDAALRSAYYLVTGKNPDADAFKNVRGEKGIKTAEFELADLGVLKVAVVSGLKNARAVMTDIKNGKEKYDFVEVMACPGGCVGGGGQPIHEGEDFVPERSDMLWSIDKNSTIRYSHQNSEILTLYNEYMDVPMSKKAHHLLHTNHTEWKMPNQK